MVPLANILRKVAADSTLAFVLNVVSVPLSFLTSLVMARLYGAKAMGTYFIATYLITTAGIVCTLGLNTGLLRFTAALKTAGHSGDLRRLFWRALGTVSFLSGLAAVALLAFRGSLSSYYKAPDLPALLFFVALALPAVVAVSLFQETVRSLGGVRWVVVQECSLKPLCFLGLIIFFAYAGLGYLGKSAFLGVAFLASTLLGLGFLACSPGSLSFLFRAPERGGGASSFTELLRYSWPLFLVAVFSLSWSGLDSLMLGLYTSPEVVAYYGIATRTMPLVIFPLMAVNAVVPPLFVQFYQQGDLGSLELLAQTTARWTYYLALPIALLLMLLAPEILHWFGSEFTKARFALSVLVLAQLVNVASGSVGFILNMTGNQWTLLVIQIVMGAGVTPLVLLSAAWFGLNGVAVIKALGVAGLNVAMAWAVWRRLKIKAFVRKVHRANLSGLLALCLFFLVRPFLGTIGAAVVFSLGYLALLGKTLWQEIQVIFPQPLADPHK
jgi:O-antigen/teichoic acid export membrane protein